jgi:hypothetical protein
MVGFSPTAAKLTLIWKDNETPSGKRPDSNLTSVEKRAAMESSYFPLRSLLLGLSIWP